MPRWALLFLAMLVSGMFANPVHAQNKWTRMQAGANLPGIQSLYQQCLNSMSRSGWKTGDCVELRSVAERGGCRRMTVPEGARYAALTRAGGQVQGNTVKQLGSPTPALRCTLSSGKTVHWFTGFEGACNNLGFPTRRTSIFKQGGSSTILPRPKMTVVPGPGITVELGCCCNPTELHLPGSRVIWE